VASEGSRPPSAARSSVDVILIDRTNHHLFQPLLYQGAISALTRPDRWPIRNNPSAAKKYDGHPREVTGVTRRNGTSSPALWTAGDVSIPYDYLILASGARQSYFGHDEFGGSRPA